MGNQISLPHSARAMGVRVTGTRGAGKTRLLSRMLAWSDVQAGIPLVTIDPSGALSDNIIDVILRLPKVEQERLKLRDRVVYVDMAGTGANGHALGFPLLYRMAADESLYDQAMRFISVSLKVDPDLRRAPILGANALTKIGLHTGMLLAAMGLQLSEAEDMLDRPQAWTDRIQQALSEHPDELQEAARYFLDTYPRLPERERQTQTSAFRSKISMFADPVLRAIYGADRPGIDWNEVVKKRQCVLLDFRNVPEHQKRFAVVWGHYGLLEWIRRRGPGRHKPISVITDEATYLLSDASAREDPLAEDLEELISRLARNNQIWLTYCHQELNQLNDRAARLFMDLGSQILGRSADLESAITIAKRFYRYNPNRVKKLEPMYMRDEAGAYVIDERSTEFSMQEQDYLNALPLMDLPAFNFLLGVAPREGELPTNLDRISIEHHDRGQFVQEELVAQARALLMAKHPKVSDVLSSIAARLNMQFHNFEETTETTGKRITEVELSRGPEPKFKRRSRATV